MGASSSNQPNHLKGLTFWNPVNTTPDSSNYTFMKDDGIYGRVIMPYIIGMTGTNFSVAPRSQYINVMIEKGTAAYTEVPADSEKQAYIDSLGYPFSHRPYLMLSCVYVAITSKGNEYNL